MSKVVKTGKLKPVTGGPGGKVGKQGGAAHAVAGRVSTTGNKSGGGKWAKGGGTGKVGNQPKSSPSPKGKVAVSGGK